ncbi:hypothetical protein ACWIID_09265 [Streptomyces phaeochromogenes]
MSPSQIAEARSLLGFTAPADNEGVLRSIRLFRHADKHRTDPTAVVQALSAGASLAWRLVDDAAELAVFRSTIARLVVANRNGDDYGLGDLRFELESASIDLDDELAIAEDLARAAGREGLL